MSGAASHIDLFDYKPELIKRHGQKSDFGEPVEAFQDGLGPWLRPVWEFRPHGESGKPLGEVVADLGDCVDDMAFVHNMVGKTGVHSSATLLQATGFQTPGFPGAGCWVSYALGSLNENLPTFVVLPDHRGFASNGPKNWDSAFLPAQHQGTAIFPGSTEPIAYLRRPLRTASSPPKADAAGLDLLGSLEPQATPTERPGDARLDARIRSYELAARMQLAAPEALDLSEGAGPRPQALRARPRPVVVRPRDQRRSRRSTPSAASAWSPAACWSEASASSRSGRATTTASPGATGTRTRTSSATTARSPRGWPEGLRP